MMRGASVNNGNSSYNGSSSYPWSWQHGYQAPRPVSTWDYLEGRLPE